MACTEHWVRDPRQIIYETITRKEYATNRCGYIVWYSIKHILSSTANATLFSFLYLFFIKKLSVNLYLAEFICQSINIDFATIWRNSGLKRNFLGGKCQNCIFYHKTFGIADFYQMCFVCMVSLIQETRKTQNSSNFTEISKIAFFKNVPHILKTVFKVKPKPKKGSWIIMTGCQSFRTQVMSYLLLSFRTYFLVISYLVTTISYPGHFVPILVISYLSYLGQLGTKWLYGGQFVAPLVFGIQTVLWRWGRGWMDRQIGTVDR